ncbi:MAG: hypothetical protein C4583_04935 [Anaerolineaceae bacterium]|nr:MAG: hypothetical protein C4583_04935 [Anaerolineaceae bacterium]
MKTFRLITGILAIIPLALFIASIADPKFTMRNPAAEWLFILVGTPILVLNLWAWDAPHIIKTIFRKN